MPANPPTIVLFDIDGTLILTGGAGRRALARAFEQVTGRRDAVQGISFGGMTDRAIARQALTAIGHRYDEALVERLFDAYVEALHDELARCTNYRVMPGVHALLEQLAPLPDVAVGLGTGNLRRGAEAKLRVGALWEPFAFGGFGCDHEERCELLRIGAARGAQALGVPREACRVVVVGDTVRDVIAALGIAARCVAVETGGVSPAELRAAGADAVFEDLTNPDVLSALLSDSP